MSNTVDCTLMSNSVCGEPDPPEAPRARANQPESATTRTAPEAVSSDCMNDCVSSLGVTSLLSASVVTVGCFALPPACVMFAGAVPGAVFGACHAACEDLESEAKGVAEP